MPCIHGLDEINCPTCRTIRSTLPNNVPNKKDSPYLKIENPFFNKNERLNEKISKEITAKKLNITHPSLNFISKPTFINEIPNFENKMFLDRFKELDLSKEDNFGISKKIPLESPEWKFEEEE